MIKITLEPARNGVIKKVVDDNYGGANQVVSEVDVYESGSGGSKHDHIVRFFYDLCEDLGLDLGSKFDKETLSFNKSWGSHYEPSKKEIVSRINELKAELQLLEELKSDK